MKEWLTKTKPEEEPDSLNDKDRFPNLPVPFAMLRSVGSSLRFYITPLSIPGVKAFRS